MLEDTEEKHLEDDWETSSEYLAALENRMKEWHEQVSDDIHIKKERETIFTLPRYKKSSKVSFGKTYKSYLSLNVELVCT